MFFDDHLPPHFHVKYNEYDAQIDISLIQTMHGKLPQRVLSLVAEWAKIHQKE